MTAATPAPDSFEEQALPHLESLYRMALHLTGEPAPAQDLVQDTMLKAFRAWHQFRPGTNARSWLLTILRNTFINEYRRRRREPVLADIDTLEPKDVYRSVAQADPEGAFFSAIVDDRVLQALDGLPLEFREVVALSDVEGLPYADIAEILKIPVGTVKSRLSRARRLLQGELYEHAVEMGYLKARSSS